MIIWNGLGFLGAVIPIVVILLMNTFLGPEVFGWALLTSAVPVWLLGRNFHARPEEGRLDPNTKQSILIKSKHDLFWVELDYWGIMLAILGIAYLMPEGMVNASVQIATGIIVLIFLARLGYRFYTHYLKKNPPQKKHAPRGSESSSAIQNVKEGHQLTKAELKKKAFYAQMRKDREKDKNFKTSDHANYFPGSSQPIPPILEIEEEIFFEEE